MQLITLASFEGSTTFGYLIHYFYQGVLIRRYRAGDCGYHFSVTFSCSIWMVLTKLEDLNGIYDG